MRLLQRFSSSLLSVEYPSAADAPSNLRVFRRKVELSFNILKDLQESADSALARGNISPVSRKKGRAVANKRQIDLSSFDSMGITVPTTDAEVRDVYVGVLSQLRSILEVCRFMVNSPREGLNNSSTTSSFSESRFYRRSSNLHTPRRNYHRRECLPQRRSWGQINLNTQRFL